MDSEAANREQELRDFITDQISDLNVEEFLQRPTVETMSYFLLTIIRLFPGKSEEKFSVYCQEVKNKYAHLCGDQRLGLAYAAHYLARPFLSLDHSTCPNFSLMDVLNPTPARVKQIALECMNFYGLIDLIENNGTHFSDVMFEWEERNKNKELLEKDNEKLVRDIDSAKAKREKLRCTKSAHDEHKEKLEDMVRNMVKEEKELLAKKAAIIEERDREALADKEVEEEIKKAQMIIEGLKEQIVESPEKAQIQIGELVEAFQQLKNEVNEAEEMLSKRKRDIGMRKEGSEALKKDMALLAQIMDIENSLQTALQTYKDLYERQEEMRASLKASQVKKAEVLSRMEAAEAKDRVMKSQIRAKLESCNEDIQQIDMECAEWYRHLAEDELVESQLLSEIASLGNELKSICELPHMVEHQFLETAQLIAQKVKDFAMEVAASIEGERRI